MTRGEKKGQQHLETIKSIGFDELEDEEELFPLLWKKRETSWVTASIYEA